MVSINFITYEEGQTNEKGFRFKLFEKHQNQCKNNDSIINSDCANRDYWFQWYCEFEEYHGSK